MDIVLKKIPIKELVKGYVNNVDEGTVVGYSGRLNMRPVIQRNFCYTNEEMKRVIISIMNGYPIGIMYWTKVGDDKYELLDGQQRLISICEYVASNNFSVINPVILNSELIFDNIKENYKDLAEKINNYELMVYFCEGKKEEQIEWFKVINIANKILTLQEIRNAIYAGLWTYEAKRWFSNYNCAAYNKFKDYMDGDYNRQAYLETVIGWIAPRDNLTIDGYMSKHMGDKNIDEIWLYFEDVVDWVTSTFIVYRKIMKGVEWGVLYNKYKVNKYDPIKLEKRIKELIIENENDGNEKEITNLKGIYEFLLSGEKNEKVLSLRKFDERIKTRQYERQGGICSWCGSGKHYELNEMVADHKKAWSKGGRTIESNCELLCVKHNNEKSNK